MYIYSKFIVESAYVDVDCSDSNGYNYKIELASSCDFAAAYYHLVSTKSDLLCLYTVQPEPKSAPESTSQPADLSAEPETDLECKLVPKTEENALLVKLECDSPFDVVSDVDAETPAVPNPAVLNDTPAVPNDTPAVPNDTPAVPNDTPAVPNDTPAVPNDTPAVPNDTPAVPNDTPAVPNDTAAEEKEQSPKKEELPKWMVEDANGPPSPQKKVH
jgi:hypothetical protein